jgi:hypothetical protein
MLGVDLKVFGVLVEILQHLRVIRAKVLRVKFQASRKVARLTSKTNIQIVNTRTTRLLMLDMQPTIIILNHPDQLMLARLTPRRCFRERIIRMIKSRKHLINIIFRTIQRIRTEAHGDLEGSDFFVNEPS